MRDIAMPEVRLPDIKIPDGLREMNLDDIVQAAQGRVQAAQDMLPKRSDLPSVDLSKVELPKQIAERLPGRRRRTNPLFPLVGVLAVGAAIAAAIWLFTSPATGPRLRHVFADLRNKVTGQRTDLIRYDEEDDLGSLLADSTAGNSPTQFDPHAESGNVTDLSTAVPLGPAEVPEGLRSN